jgi:hypothetical protein
MKGDWNYRKIRELSPDYKSGALPLSYASLPVNLPQAKVDQILTL